MLGALGAVEIVRFSLEGVGKLTVGAGGVFVEKRTEAGAGETEEKGGDERQGAA